MAIEIVDFAVGDETYEGRLNVQSEDADEGVVIVPGAGHGPFGNIFDVVAYELAGAGKQVFRYDSWESHDELEEKTLSELHRELEAAVDYLRSNGCSSVAVIAKSFGGGIALTHDGDGIEGLLLWAPAVELTDDPAVVDEPDARIGDSDELAIGIPDLDHVDVPVRILVGDEDRGVSPEDCRRIVDAVGEGEVTTIPGENHGFNANRTAIVDHTLEYLAGE
ncbi:alpha/beta hydrolase [Halopiger goleimassiliensis]|uniref:alpha/beta hydrolase n=1 Tax=Halopiger goleimassiliensis TaxID=1293048 RepID=UPI000677C3FF|nr:alpha/beta hydrolase [Halopiger goleimassiliensis]